MDIRFKTVRGLAKLPLKPRFQLHSCLQYLHPFQYFHDRWHQRALFFTFPGLCHVTLQLLSLKQGSSSLLCTLCVATALPWCVGANLR